MLDRFYEKTIAFPFKIDGNGNVNYTTSQDTIWADRIRAVIGTLYGERVMVQNFGTRVPSYVFSNQSTVSERIKQEIDQAIFQWLPKIVVNQVEVGQIQLDGSVEVTLFYTLPNNTDANISVGIVAIDGNSPSVEAKL
jgi:phage baseplate assembly protein W